MTIYFVVLFVATIAIYLGRKAGDRTTRLGMYAIAFASMVLIGGLRSGLRGSAVGTDSWKYVIHFEEISSFADIWRAKSEPGFFLLCWLGKLVSNDYAVMFTLVAIIVTLCFLGGIRELSVNPGQSVFVLLTSGLLFFSFNGARQGIAIAIFFLSIGTIYRRKPWLFLVYIAVACFFHLSAILMLPAYLVVPRKNDLRYNMLVLSLAAISVVFFAELISLAELLDMKSRGYALYGTTYGSPGGLVFSAFLLALGTFFLYFKRHVQQHRPLYDLLVNLFLLGLVVSAISFFKKTDPSGILRLANYFSASQILLWPIVFTNIRDRMKRATVLGAFVIVYLIYYGLTLQAWSNMVPYSFNPVVHTWLPKWF